MNYAPFIVAIVLAAALIPLAIQCGRVWPRLWGIVFVLWIAVPVGAGYFASEWDRNRMIVQEEDVQHRPRQVASDGYIQSKNCRACHLEQYASWHHSFHRTMTQIASDDAIVGDFDGVTLEIGGRKYHLIQDGGRYFVDISKANAESELAGKSYRGEIVMTTGSHHMQAYWYTSGKGRLTVQLPFVWLIPEQAWIPEPHSFLQPDRPHGDDNMANWNASCVNCHTTHGCQGGIPVSPSIDTRAAEFGIACEACHGPAEEHVKVNRNPVQRYQKHLAQQGDSTIQNPAKMNHQKASEVCGACHAGARCFSSVAASQRQKTQGSVYRPGGDLSDERIPLQPRNEQAMRDIRALLRKEPYLKGRFWSDGMARVSGSEYNGMIDSPCYQHGDMSCLSCHIMHPPNDDTRLTEEWTDDQLKRDMRGNEACLQCHQDLADSLTDHTHHAADSSGSVCYNCHMPYSAYGLLKAIRSHTISSPSVQESLHTGRANACNQCHLDKTLEWTGSHLQDWFGITAPPLDREQQQVAASVLWTLMGDAGQRAVMAWSLGWDAARETTGSNWQVPYLAQLLVDPYPAVRIVAYRSLVRLPGFADFQYDLNGSQQDRLDAHNRALVRWSTSKKHFSGKIERANVLMNDQGQVEQSQFDRLLKRRDNRHVSLDE